MTRRPTRLSLTLIGSILCASASGCATGEDVTTRALDKARARWEQAALNDYNIEWTSSGARLGHYRVAVRQGEVVSVQSVLPDGRVVEARPGDPSYYSVEGLFRVLEEELDHALSDTPFGRPRGTRVLLKFVTDPVLGYPTRYRRDVAGTRQGLAIDVVSLVPVAEPSKSTARTDSP